MPAPKHTIEEIQAAIAEEGSKAGAARKLGLDLRSMFRRLNRAESREGYTAHGYSTLRKFTDDEGEVILEWEKTSKDKQQQAEAFDEYAKGLMSKIKPSKPIKAPKVQNTDLINLFVISDYHLGMMAWHGDNTDAGDWDMKIAEDLLFRWFQTAIVQAPDADTAILCELGDFLHWDGMDAVTPSHGNILDADTRWGKLTRVAAKLKRRIIGLLLEKYSQVHVKLVSGNHDPASSGLYRVMMDEIYINEPRVTVDMSSDLYHVFEFGNTSLFFHHGHKRSPKNVAEVFIAKFREIYGRTEFSYAHLGHRHSTQVAEGNLMIVEQHSTLAAPDAYAAHGGWVSKRNAKVSTYHKKYGKVGELVISPDMVWGAK